MTNDLLRRIHAARQKIKNGTNHEDKRDYRSSVAKVIIDLIASVGVGGFIGYEIDRYFIIAPFFLILCTLIGMVSGILSLYLGAVNGSRNDSFIIDNYIKK